MEEATRRAFLHGMIGAGAGIGLLGLGACRPAQRLLRVGSQKGGTKALMLASGVLSGAGYAVEWSEFAAAQPLLEAIGSGAVDLGMAGDAPFLFAYESGSPIRAVAAQRTQSHPAGALAIVVPGGSHIRQPDDLRDARIATTRGSVGHYLVLRVLERLGWPGTAVHLSFLAPNDSAAALHTGAVDAWSTWGPYVALAEAGGARIVADGRDYTDSYGFDVANLGAIAHKRALLVDFLTREVQALGWAVGHVDAYATLLAQETGLPPAIARTTAERNARVHVAIDTQTVLDQQQVIDSFARAGVIHPTRSLRGAFAPLL